MPIADIALDFRTKVLLKKLARNRKINLMAAAKLAFERGLEIAEAMKYQSENHSEADMEAQLAALARDIELRKNELSAISSRAASEHFFAFEEYQRVSSLIRLYLVRRSEAKSLAENLKRLGISIDLHEGEIEDIENLERRYLFKK